MSFERHTIARAEACERCEYVACVCEFRRAHATTCKRRLAVLDTKPRPCEPHASFACEVCHPCTCGKNEAADAVVAALRPLEPDAQARALAGAVSLLGLEAFL